MKTINIMAIVFGTICILLAASLMNLAHADEFGITKPQSFDSFDRKGKHKKAGLSSIVVAERKHKH